MYIPRTVCAVILLSWASAASGQTTWYVDDDNCPGPGSGSQADPLCTIQTGINAAGAGDTVLVSPGTYVEHINLLGKAITLRSTNPTNPAVVAATIIDGNASGSVVTCNSSEGPDTVIEGFTITNGLSAPGAGMDNVSSSPTVSNCIFSGNAGAQGAGMDNRDGSSPTVTNCTFSGNQASTGGGMNNSNASNPTLVNCAFNGNSVSEYGGGISNFNSSPVLINCTFSGNWSTSQSGGGIFNSNSSPMLVNCTFSGNWSLLSGGGVYNDSASTATLTNCILWGNTAPAGAQIYDAGSGTSQVSYSCVEGGWNGVGNISTDPLLVDADGLDNVYGTADDDVHLLDGSPCINAGDDDAVPAGITTDFDGDARIQLCRVDMGVDETPYMGSTTDCNANGVLDECDIEAGTSDDCNANLIPDECDIADGTSEDCNTNGVLDQCDIAAGSSPDTNPQDGVPDECQGVLPVNGACCLGDYCIVATETACSVSGGTYNGDNTICSAVECLEQFVGDLDHDGDVDIDDFGVFQANFTGPQ